MNNFLKVCVGDRLTEFQTQASSFKGPTLIHLIKFSFVKNILKSNYFF